MTRLRIFRNLHTAALLLLAAAFIAGAGGLWWANRTGLPDSWRAAIEHELGKHGLHVKIGALTYVPLQGIVARDIQVFSDDTQQREISRLERVLLAADRTRLARGQLRLTKVELSDARLSLPVDPDDPESATLEITNASGKLVMPGGRLLEVREATGNVAGVQVSLGARMLGYRQGDGPPKEDPEEGSRREFIAHLVRELEHWHFDSAKPPSLRVFVEGDLSDRSTLNARLQLQAQGVEKNGHVIDEVTAEGELNGSLFTITTLRARDPRGVFEGSMDYDLSAREGRFDVTSSLEVPGLLKAWLGLPPIQHISFGGKQSMEAEGDFRLPENAAPDIRMTGRARCEGVMLRGISFDAIEGAFSWNKGDLYLRDLRLTRPDGEARGKAMIQPPLVRIALDSTLPAELYRPFFIGKPLEIVINDFGRLPGAETHIILEGGFDMNDRRSWAYVGKGNVSHMTYKGVPVESAACGFSVNHHELDFHDGTIVFDYNGYPLKKAFNGPRTGTAKVGRIRYNGADKTVDVENVSGAIWAAPMVRLFAPKIADMLEQYRFHRPPRLTASGLVDVTPRGRTSLDVSFRSDAAADYKFLDENLTLSNPSGLVRVRHQRVDVADLEFETLGGPVDASFIHRNGKLDGELSWTRLSMPAITSTYGFKMKGGGAVTGRIEFNMREGDVRTMQGEGLLALEQAELFSVPVFGPLSPLVAGILGNRKAGYEQAKGAFFTFDIKDGVLRSNDFRTTNSSLVFTGDGTVDLAEREVDMTLRMNTRGFLGLITLPLRPFYGLFQFRGHGPLAKPEWENVRFTSPPEAQKEALMNPPKATIVDEE